MKRLDHPFLILHGRLGKTIPEVFITPEEKVETPRYQKAKDSNSEYRVSIKAGEAPENQRKFHGGGGGDQCWPGVMSFDLDPETIELYEPKHPDP